MKTTIYAILIDGHTNNVKQRVELCNVILAENRMSAERYCRLKRQMWNTVKPAPKGCYWTFETSEGMRVAYDCNFGTASRIPFTAKEA